MSVRAWPNNLPQELTSFVGRAREREELAAALRGTRLLTLTGTGGAGKTRLAAEVARGCSQPFPDGAWWVELAPVQDGALVGAALTGALGVRPLPGRTIVQAAVDRLGGDRALVVLDNCEHVLEAAADLSEALLRGCPQVAVLATSREPLDVPGESNWLVPSLALPPDTNGRQVPAAVVGASDAGRLFVERAAQARSGFALTDGNATTVAQICHELEGIPLALELAAARVRMLPVEQIADRLSDRFRLLTKGPRGAVTRHRTLRASVDWSYELLPAPERLLLRRLAVFVDGWSLEAVESVCAGDGLDGDGLLDLLASLVDKSLVVVQERDGTARYRLLETVRQYALELLDRSGEHAAVRDRHLAFFLERAERAAVELVTPRNLEWLGMLEPDAANFAMAIRYGVERCPDRALRLSVGLTMWWNMRGGFAAGQSALERSLAAAAPKAGPVRARALWSCGHLASYRGDYQTAVGTVQEALAMAESIGDDATQARALYSLTALGMPQDPAGSRPSFRHAIELARRAGDDWTLMSALTTLAWSYLMTEELAEAETAFEEAAPAIERTGLEGVAWRELGLGWCALARSEHGTARERFERTIATALELGDPVTEGFAHVFLARLELLEGRVDAALERTLASEAAVVATGTFMVLPSTRVELARARAAVGQLEAAHELLEVVVAGGADGGWTLCEALLALADVLRAGGEFGGALARAQEALELGRRMGVDSLTALAREQLARLAIERREWKHAETLAHEALEQRVGAGALDRLPQSLDPLAQIATGLESYVEATRILGVARRARSDLGLARWAPDVPAFADLERMLAEQLGGEAYAAARAEGAAMPLDEAIGWLRRARGKRKRPSGGWESLTPTEMQVVQLVAQGLTNPQVAERMFVSRATVKAHLAHVFRKLDLRSRSELAAMAVRRAA